jgi:hypothetical protein
MVAPDSHAGSGGDRGRRSAISRRISANSPPRTEVGRGIPEGTWPRKGESLFKAADRLPEAEDFAIRARNALLDGRDPRTVVTAEEAEIAAAVESNSRGGPSISWLDYVTQQKAWASWKRDECLKAGRFWNLLADEHEHPDRPIERIVLERDAETRDGDRRHLIHLHHRRELRLPTAPVILLDADLDPVIARKLAGLHYVPSVQSQPSWLGVFGCLVAV